MKTQNQLLRKTALAAAVAIVVGGVGSVGGFAGLEAGMSTIISSAYAGDGSSGGGHKGAMGENRGGQGGRGAGSQGHKGGRSLADVLADDDGDDDSDRPDWAQQPGRDGKPGGGNAGDSTTKGADYGDLFVILRNDDGSPVTEGNEVYILLSDGTVVLTEGGEVPAGTDATLLQTVEFGRMNIARSPESVIEHALTEALSKLDDLSIDADNIDEFTDESGRLTVDGLTIDSPLENLALYKALLLATPNDDGVLELSATSSHDGADNTYTLLVDPDIRMDLAASALAASSDKTGDLTVDEVVLISSFMGVDDELASLVESYTYDRNITYQDTSVFILEDQGDGTWVKVEVDMLDVVDFSTIERLEFNADGDLIVDINSVGIDVFTQAADDSVQVLEYVHEYAVE